MELWCRFSQNFWTDRKGLHPQLTDAKGSESKILAARGRSKGQILDFSTRETHLVHATKTRSQTDLWFQKNVGPWWILKVFQEVPGKWLLGRVAHEAQVGYFVTLEADGLQTDALLRRENTAGGSQFGWWLGGLFTSPFNIQCWVVVLFFFIFIPTWGNNRIWLIFFRWVETTNYHQLAKAFVHQGTWMFCPWELQNDRWTMWTGGEVLSTRGYSKIMTYNHWWVDVSIFPYILPAPFLVGKKVVQKSFKKIHPYPKLASKNKVQKLQRGQLVRVRIIDLNQEEGKLQVSMLQPMPKNAWKKETDGDWLLPFVDCCFFLNEGGPEEGYVSSICSVVFFFGLLYIVCDLWLVGNIKLQYLRCLYLDICVFLLWTTWTTWNLGVPIIKMKEMTPVVWKHVDSIMYAPPQKRSLTWNLKISPWNWSFHHFQVPCMSNLGGVQKNTPRGVAHLRQIEGCLCGFHPSYETYPKKHPWNQQFALENLWFRVGIRPFPKLGWPIFFQFGHVKALLGCLSFLMFSSH